MILFAVLLILVIAGIIAFFVFAGKKKKEGQDLGEHEPGQAERVVDR
jgi:hypothetical protein